MTPIRKGAGRAIGLLQAAPAAALVDVLSTADNNRADSGFDLTEVA
jgi:hypothetical protein